MVNILFPSASVRCQSIASMRRGVKAVRKSILVKIAFRCVKKDSRKYDLAICAIDSLFTMANETRNANEDRSKRYVLIAEKIAARMDITLERGIKRSYCKSCKTIYGADTQIRLSNRILIIRCGHCGSVKRIPY